MGQGFSKGNLRRLWCTKLHLSFSIGPPGGTPGPQGPQKPKTYNFLPILMKFIWQLKKAMVHKITFAFSERTTRGGTPGPKT